MTLDSALILAESRSFEIRARLWMRQCAEAGDLRTLEAIQSLLYKLIDVGRGEIRKLKTPERWQMACECGFAWPEGVTRNMCPDCRSIMKIVAVQ